MSTLDGGTYQHPLSDRTAGSIPTPGVTRPKTLCFIFILFLPVFPSFSFLFLFILEE